MTNWNWFKFVAGFLLVFFLQVFFGYYPGVWALALVEIILQCFDVLGLSCHKTSQKFTSDDPVWPWVILEKVGCLNKNGKLWWWEVHFMWFVAAVWLPVMSSYCCCYVCLSCIIFCRFVDSGTTAKRSDVPRRYNKVCTSCVSICANMTLSLSVCVVFAHNLATL